MNKGCPRSGGLTLTLVPYIPIREEAESNTECIASAIMAMLFAKKPKTILITTEVTFPAKATSNVR